MWLKGFRFAALVVLACALQGYLPAGAQERSDTGGKFRPSFWHAAGGVTALNWVAWGYNRYVQRWPWANVGTRTWEENLRRGFVWDNDCFLDNQLAHPYHGSLYHNAARASGYGFWGSLAYVAAGSATWELFTENVPPSLNDLINTTLGGIALGEVTYRLSSLLGSKSRSGRNAFSRQVGAFALSPIARTQGLFRRGERGTDLSEEYRPEDAAWVAVGRRMERAFVELAVQYGSPFDVQMKRPYDAFEFRLQLSPEATGIVTHVGISGLLARRSLSTSTRTQVVFGWFQHYDYYDLPVFKAGGQSLSGALLYRRQLGSRSQLDLGMHLEGLLLGGISSDHDHEWRRDYDYGPGAGARLTGSLRRDGRDLLRFDTRLLWLHSMYGTKGDHLATFARLGAAVWLSGFLGVGGDVGMTTRHSWYPGLASVTQRIPEMRAYLMW